MLIGIVQHKSSNSLQMNLESIKHFALQAKNQGCLCVCFPECTLTGYIPEYVEEFAISKKNPSIDELSAFASSLGIDILAGFMEKDGINFYITHGIFYANGTIDFYRKTHLGKKEDLYFTAGDILPVFTLSCGLRAGIQLCVETHFPDITQTLSLKGAEIIFAPHAIPRISGDRKHIWMKYIPARAYDNRVYIACCNQWDSERFGGGCLCIDPRGEEKISSYDTGPALLTVDIDRTLISSFHTESSKRSAHYYPKRTRPELYKTT